MACSNRPLPRSLRPHNASRLSSAVLGLAALALLAGPALASGASLSATESTGATGSDLKTIDGRVATPRGIVVEQARVERIGLRTGSETDVGSNTAPYVTSTDAAGHFSLTAAGCVATCRVRVSHPRFVTREVEARLGHALEVVLEPKQAVYDRVEVTATRGDASVLAPVSLAVSEVSTQDAAAPPSTLAEIVQTLPGVAENGQPGLFQVVSVRGVSRQRVLTFFGGTPLAGERRAGVAASFVDPLLFGSVEVVRGPASTVYGSGALGGVLRIAPRRFDETWLASGWESFGDERYIAAGWGDGVWSVGLAHRRAEADDVADGMAQNTAFQQTSAVLERSWALADGRSLQLMLAPSLGRDIGKPNIDFPERITVYPEEEHLVFELELVDDDGWSVRALGHPNRLETETVRVGRSVATVENEAFDFGLSAQRSWRLGGDERSGWLGDGATLRLGGDWFARRGVTAEETERDLSSGETTTSATLDAARQDEAALYGDLRWRLGSTSVAAGARVTWQRQSNRGALGRVSSDDAAPSAFLGVVQPLGAGWELAANLGTGLRFPSLGERFFTGTTGRGEVIANADLEPERSLSLDTGLRYYGSRTFLAVHAFRLEVDDFIERVEIEDGVLTFVNLVSGRIQGLELEGFQQLTSAWRLDWAGHLLDGEADDGTPLADIAPDRLQLGLGFEAAPWRARLRWQYRASKDDPGSGEVAIDDAHVVSASVARRVGAVEIEVRGDNLLDSTYRSSADDKTSVAPGRSVGVGIVWSPP
ncbi:MAG: TonB-dependent receptor [Acidobacteriota bacterium]